jgi:hypothetical protein
VREIPLDSDREEGLCSSVKVGFEADNECLDLAGGYLILLGRASGNESLDFLTA